MSKKIFIKSTPELIDQNVELFGWVNSVRDHKKVVFIDLRDMSGTLQCVFGADGASLTPETAIKVVGNIKKRPPHLFNPALITGEIELQVESFEIIGQAEVLPFEINTPTLNLQLPTLLDNRPLTLRNSFERSIFALQATVLDEFRIASKDLGCQEIVTPALIAGSSEGGSEVFKLKYFDHEAYLVQSPQLYKQMVIPAFERVFMISKAFRAETSVTTRHLTEVVQLDCEFGFVDFETLLDYLEEVGTKTILNSAKKHEKLLSDANIALPRLDGKVPRLTVAQALELVFNETGRDIRGEPDLDPEAEKFLCEWALSIHGSDFVTITHFPMSKRPFYTMVDPKDPSLSVSYDLLFRGIEILSGAQREHRKDILEKQMHEKGVKPSDFPLYMQAFAYGMPVHGGFSFGLERVTMKILELDNVRRASLFPRDMERIDIRLND